MNFSSSSTPTMPGRSALAFIVAALLAISPFQNLALAADSSAAASEAQPSSTVQSTTTAGDQTDLSVTVYNPDLALVRDVRQIDLPAGESELRFMDIAASINPATVHFRSLADPGKLNVLEQNYEYDLLDPAQAAAEIRGPRTHRAASRAGQRRRRDALGGGAGHAARRQQRARLENRRRNRHRLNVEHRQLPRVAGKSLRPAHAALDAGKSAAPRDRQSRPRISRRIFPGAPTTCSP